MRTTLLRGNDTPFHYYRFLGTAHALQDGQFPPQVAIDQVGGAGYGTNIFYGPLTSYAAVILRALTGEWVLAINLLTILAFVLSGFTMYAFIHSVSGSRLAGYFAATVFLTTPYRITDVWTRQAQAEIWIFVFGPMVFHGLWSIAKGRDRGVQRLAVGAAALVLSHNLSALMIALFAVPFAIIYWRQLFHIRSLARVLGAFALAAGSSSFYLLPLLEVYRARIYQVFDHGSPFSQLYPAKAPARALSLARLLYGDSSVSAGGDPGNVATNVGWIVFLGLVAFAISWRRMSRPVLRLACTCWALGAFAALLCTEIAPWTRFPDLLLSIQFPWRFLTVASLFFSAGSGLAIYYALPPPGVLRTQIAAVRATLSAGLVALISLWAVAGPLQGAAMRTAFPTSYFSDTSVSHLSEQIAKGEYLPVQISDPDLVWPSLESLSRAANVLSGPGSVTAYAEDGSHATFSLSPSSEPTIVELPFVFYPGYQARLTTSSSTTTIPTRVSPNGLVQLEFPPGSGGRVDTRFGRSPATNLGLGLSTVTVLVWFGISLVLARVRRRNSPPATLPRHITRRAGPVTGAVTPAPRSQVLARRGQRGSRKTLR
jgi:hypothetical protein